MKIEKKSINELKEKYDIKVNEIVKKIKEEKVKNVLLQFPEGLKPYSIVLVDEIRSKTKNVNVMIWFDSCFGACDIPIETERLGIDLIIQFGHTSWGYNNKEILEIK